MAVLNVRHITRYRYRKPVAFGEHRMMFRPCESYDQRLLESRLVIIPEPVELRFMHDVFGNCVAIARFEGTASELSFDSQVRLEHQPVSLLDDPASGLKTRSFPFAYGADDMPDLARSAERAYPDPERRVEQWAQRFVRRNEPTVLLTMLAEMTRTIRKEFTYAGRLTVGVQTPLETLKLGAGSCRDFAMFMIEAVRSLGLAAQFVSGYIYSAHWAGDQAHRGGGHTHAWLRVYLPDCGWVEFDPTNGIVGNTDLVRVAVARDPRQALPLYGTWAGEAEDYLGMDVDVGVTVEANPIAARPVAFAMTG